MSETFRCGVLVACLLFGSVAAEAIAATSHVVMITLQDPSGDPFAKGMVMKSDTAKVKAGRVTFRAANLSKDLVHEMLVLPAPPDGKDLPFDARTNTVVEKRAHSLGEIPELKPGAKGSLTVTLRPGTYLLICNQPGHYKGGMATTLVVEK